ncbi:MAG TPA: MerR family transcriptional regulator [Gammaproteobacteria bacterium]|nr:MerR family transcriptional regulator [Gammaproteobacteria bacterium]
MPYGGALTVTQLAQLSGTTPDTVRYYTRMGLLRPARNPDNGYRLFQPRDAKRLAFIRQAKQLGFTLSEIASITHDAERKHSPCPQVRTILERRIAENRRKLDELIALQARMEQALKQWRDLPDGVPDGESVCYLIESFDPETPGRNARHS